MELIAQAANAAEPPPVGIELVLTVAEEQGLRGAKAFDPSILRSRCGFVLDHAGPVGEVIVATPTQHKVRADFNGVEAHAGIRPEDETTANVGLIEGGTSGNVVPGHCWIHAEARSLDAARAAEVAGSIADACAWGASEHGCDVDVRIEELFRGYRVPLSSPSLALAEGALRDAGVEPVRTAIGGGSDANVFRLDGYDCLLLANGTNAVHTSEEHVALASLEKMLEVCQGIVAAAATG